MDHLFLAGFSGPVVFGAITCGSALVLLIGFLALRIWRYRQPAYEHGSAADFSLDRYQPIVSVFSGEDLDFLAAQPGCRPEILSRLRRDRRRIFRMYLRELALDFRALHAEARKMAALCPDAHSRLVASLARQQVVFWWALAGIEMRLVLPQRTGLDIRELIAAVEALRLDVAKMAA